MNMTILAAIAAGLIILLLIFVVGFVQRRRPKKINQAVYKERWQTLQKHCAQKATWPLAIIDADKLMDDALKRRGYRGKTMGERLVAAQRQLSSNDTIWFGHKLRNKLVHEEYKKLSKRDVVTALSGFRQALKDLGALEDSR